MRVFAAGASTNLIEVYWRGGAFSRIPNCQPNFVYEIDEAGAASEPPPRRANFMLLRSREAAGHLSCILIGWVPGEHLAKLREGFLALIS